VILLFTDLVGSTELLGQLGDDEAERFRRVYSGLVRDVAAVHRGHEVKNLGDGLMVAFASAVNALDCAVGIQRAVYRHNARQGDERLKVRVGLTIGEPIRDEDDYFGTPVVVAKRLCDSAEGGQILASELLRVLVGTRGGFAFRSCGTIALKGVAEPLPAVDVQWEPAPERRIPLPAPLLRDDEAPLVGRAGPLDQLSRCWEEARTGCCRVAMLVGEPGIGKTRLAAEFCRGAYSEGALVLLGRCYEESLIPYQPFVEALRSYAAECPLDELRLHIGPHRRTLARLVPELGEPSAEPADHPFIASSEHERFLLFDAVASLLGAVANEHALILVLEDLHWADAPTLLLLRHVARVLEGDRLLVLGTYRQTEVHDAHPLSHALAELRRARALDSLAIGGLGEEDVAALISSRSAGDLPASLVRSIVERTEGNPFFVEEVLREVAADGDALAGIPESVKDLLLRRMRPLDDACKRLLTFAAVTGYEFTLDVLEIVSDAAPDTLVETLEQAIAAHIVDETDSIGRFTFAHALIRETIYEQLSFTRRAQLHRLIGEAIESQGHDRPAELAYHFAAAGNVAKGYEYHSRAAAAAERMYAIEPALSHCTAAIDAADKLGLDPDREPTLRRLLLQRGRMRFRTGDRRARTDYESALASARRSADRATEMDALNELALLQLGSDVAAGFAFSEAALAIAEELADPVALTTTLDRLGVISSNQLEFSRGIELGERALELARPTGDPNLIGRALDSIKLAVWQLGDLHRLEELTAELEPIWRERGELWFLQFTLLESAFVPIGAARWEQAAERLAEAAAINRRIRDPAADVLILDAVCWLHRSRGTYDEALSAGRRAIAHGPATGLWEGWAAATLGWALLDLGAADDAADVLERGLKSAERIRSANQTTRCLSQLAWAHSLHGDAERASALAGRAAELLDRVSTPPGSAFLFGAQAYAALARVYLDRGEAERGEALLLPVLRAAERCGWLEAAAATELVVGLCLEARGELERAITTLAHAAEVADRAGIPAPSWEAHGALGRVLRAAGRDGEAEEHAANAAATVERLCGSVSDDALRDRLRERASR
jgi:class 3 adenylate cyclase/tetratricopeptide (TPR) repeat protein